jgi:hypothetical protein
MSNTNYVKGRAFEYARMRYYKNSGFDVVMRTAGSHGPYDIVAINAKTGEIFLIQCKVTESPATATRMLNEFRKNPPVPPMVLPPNVHQGMDVKVHGSSQCQSAII